VILTVTAALLTDVAVAQVRVAENSGKRKLDDALIVETYKQVVRQMNLRGHVLKQQPEIALHVVSAREATRRLDECTQGGCGHVLRMGVSLDQQARIVFVTLASEGAKLWMDEPDGYMLAKSVAVVLDYENRLYLPPDDPSSKPVARFRPGLYSRGFARERRCPM
jgi:hypothetical protein